MVKIKEVGSHTTEIFGEPNTFIHWEINLPNGNTIKFQLKEGNSPEIRLREMCMEKIIVTMAFKELIPGINDMMIGDLDTLNEYDLEDPTIKSIVKVHLKKNVPINIIVKKGIELL